MCHITILHVTKYSMHRTLFHPASVLYWSCVSALILNIEPSANVAPFSFIQFSRILDSIRILLINIAFLHRAFVLFCHRAFLSPSTVCILLIAVVMVLAGCCFLMTVDALRVVTTTLVCCYTDSCVCYSNSYAKLDRLLAVVTTNIACCRLFRDVTTIVACFTDNVEHCYNGNSILLKWQFHIVTTTVACC